jgi:uncharacterized protein YecT (DUF1311 family)
MYRHDRAGRVVTRMAIICLLTLSSMSPILATSVNAESAKEPAEQLCDADRIGNTNAYIKCLQQAQKQVDKDLDDLVARIPRTAKARDEVLADDVAPVARERWRRNFSVLVPAFRAFRDKDCEDNGIVEAGYGMGGLQSRLVCIINTTAREIDILKQRYEVREAR